MGKQEKLVLTLDRYEHGVVVNALNEMRNDLLEEERPTDIVDEVLLKVIDKPAILGYLNPFSNPLMRFTYFKALESPILIPQNCIA